jgi:2-oxoacid dehydrogenases acyltransferase (catalytic domain)
MNPDTSPRAVPGLRVSPRALRAERSNNLHARSGRRDRVALITWRRPRDAQIHATIRLEWDLVASAHPHIIPVALVGFALAQSLARNPTANRRVVLWKIRAHQSVCLSFAVDANDELRMAMVDNADQLSPKDFQHALRLAANDSKHNRGPFANATSIVERMPVVIGRPILRLFSLITVGLGVSLLGVPGDPFGAALISSVERFHLPAATVPFVPFSRCALVCSVGAITKAAVVRNDELVVIDTVDIAITFDHRVCDGAQLAALLHDFESFCYNKSDATWHSQ